MKAGVALVALLILAPAAAADGKFYVREEVAADVPYQRAVLFFDGEREALVLQSKYEIREGMPPPEIAWVVPVPSVPEVAAFEEDSEGSFFREFVERTAPRVFSAELLSGAAFLVAGVALFALSVRLLSRLRAWGVPCLILALIVGPAGISLLMVAVEHQGAVRVLSEHVAGVYDVRVVRAAEGAGLADWLAAEGFAVGPADREVFDTGIRRGYSFVTARVRPAAKAEAKERLSVEGLAPALVLAFDTPEAFYPLALTATAGRETEVVLWVVAPHRMDAQGRLPVRFAGEHHFAAGDAKWPEVLRQERWSQRWITKLKGRLTAEQMRDDLILRPADQDEPLRETVFTW